MCFTEDRSHVYVSYLSTFYMNKSSFNPFFPTYTFVMVYPVCLRYAYVCTIPMYMRYSYKSMQAGLL